VDQLKRLIEEASLALRPGKKYDPGAIQLLLCGDFNSLPESGVIEYIENGYIRADHVDFKSLSYKKALARMSSETDQNTYSHKFQLKSAIRQELMPYTNYTFDFKGMIDYIFYPRKTMKPMGVLGPVDSNWLKENKVIGCPHPHLTSGNFKKVIGEGKCEAIKIIFGG
jgi:CCR4-NOT transcription complex subunit 6